MIVLVLLLMSNSVSAVWIYPDVDIIVGDFTLNTKSAQNFTYVEIGTTYTNLSWDGATYHNITYVTNVSSSESAIHKSPGYSLNQTTNISFNLYAPSDYAISITLDVITAAGVTNASVTPTIHHSNTTHKFYYYHYNPTDNIPDAGLGWFDVNISATVTNETLTYTGYNLTEDLFQVFLVEPPYNGTSFYNTTLNGVNLTWQNGNNSEYTIVVQNNNSYPATPSDGWVRSNSSSFTTFNDTNVYSTRYYTIFNYNTTYNMYSKGLNIPWGALGLSCFNESNSSQAIGFDIEITNNDASITYTASGLTNTHYIDLNDIPYGDNTLFVVTNSSYKLRPYVRNLTINHFYNFSFRLPPLETTGGDDTGDGTLRIYTNVAEVTNPAVNITISLTQTMETVIEVSRYDNIPAYTSFTDSIAVTNSSLDATINFTYTPNSITAVYIYNDTTFGGWILVPQDKYTYNDTELVVNNSWMDVNTTTARVDYLYIFGYSGSWIIIPDSMYTASSSQIEIDNAILNSNTTMAKVTYYYMDYDTTIDTQLYILTVVGPQNEYTSPPVEGAKIIIKRYMDTSNSYEEIASLLTDANGNAEVYLIPETNLKIFISKDGYDSTVSTYIPSDSIPTKTFRITPTITSPPEYDIFWDDITLSGEMFLNNTIKITYCDSNESTSDTQIYLYDVYNGSFTLINTNTKTENNDYVYWVAGINSSRDHEIWLYFNNTANYASTTSPVVIMIFAVNVTWDQNIVPFDMEDRFEDLFGPFPLGYVNVIAIIIPIILLCIFGPFNAGVGILAAGVSLGFVQVILFVYSPVWSNPFLVLISPVAIVIGFLYIMSMKGEEHI